MASQRQARMRSTSLRALCAAGAVTGLVACGFSAAVSFAALPSSASNPGQQLQVQSGAAAPAACAGWGASGDMELTQSRSVRGGNIARKAMTLDLKGKVAFIAGVADTSGYGWAIARELANAGATIVIGTWPPVLKMFEMTLKKSSTAEAMKLDDGSMMEISKVYPLDAVFDVPEDVPDDIKANKRYAGVGGFTIQEVVDAVSKDYGKVDILVHSLANGPEVTKPLLETSRKGYLAASSASAYSMVSMVSRFGKIMTRGGSVMSLSYIAAERTIPGYGGGMSSAKAQLESDTRTLAWEAGRKYGIRVNTISAGPLKSRAASAIGGDGGKTFIERAIDYSVANAPLSEPLYAEYVGKSALCLLSDLTQGVTGTTMYVDMGLHAMGQSIDSPAFEGLDMSGK
eukprot:CAMPEP_0115089028 /NCGR_PEP_ID=MMETSP0227-20121206/24392_1 /TAXON_ID=89957 /ORGANISM="Polarella glacialis, Strain CCMP 1383" /LENGTH=399 /DNA_ID=CAMNT_0002479509 /DNA_START=84 /DNA_END=1283 /DNA_ORIENTATION=+